MKNLKFVIDTNILLVSVSEKSPFHWVFKKIRNGELDLAVSNDILTEYREIISGKLNTHTAGYVCEFLSIAENVHRVDPYYNWDLIKQDRDDNKFVDCAVASNADYIVTNDRHFNILKNIGFPEVRVIDFNEFEKLLKKM